MFSDSVQYLLDFDGPIWLLLLVVVLPWIIWSSRHSLAGLGRVRRWLALGARCLVALLLVLAAAEMQWIRHDDRLTVIYLVDRSLSVPPESLPRAIGFVNRTLGQQPGRRPADRAGMIVFGRDAAIEMPPLNGEVHMPLKPESLIDPEGTDLSAAMRLARAAFPPEGAKRIVIISDGNQTRSDALSEAQALADAGIGIDVVPIRYPAHDDIRIEKVTSPTVVRPQQPFELRVVLDRSVPADQVAAARPIKGRLRVTREDQLLSEESITVAPGKQVLSVRQELSEAGFHNYDVQFLPDEAEGDFRVQNNRARAFTYVSGWGKILLIENGAMKGEYNDLVRALRDESLEVVVQPSNHLYTSLAELQQYDTVILANVPRSSEDPELGVAQFSNDQIAMLARNTHDSGSGLVVLGGPESFGAGGWTNTDLEKALPVDFSVDSYEVKHVGALALVIDRSGSMGGEKINMARIAAAEAVRQLGRDDQVCVIAFDTFPTVIVPMMPVGDGAAIRKRISRIEISGGTDMYPGMLEGYAPLAKVLAAVKHMIVMTDGQTDPRDSLNLARKMRSEKMTVSTVALGTDAAANLLQDIAKLGGGKFYSVKSPQAIPRIFMHEARRVARPVVYEDAKGFQPLVKSHHEIIAGLPATLPPINGLVLTRPKASPLVEIPIVSPKPDGKSPLLACWTYGLGRAAAITTDAGQRWAKTWPDWDGYLKLYTQIIRWSMRPTNSTNQFLVATHAEEGQTEVVVTALDQEQRYLNFLNLSGTVVGPKLEAMPLSLRQVAPGRYVGNFPSPESGGYFITLNPHTDQALIRAGVVVPYAAEFNDREANEKLLASLAAVTPKGGEPGVVIDVPLDGQPDTAPLTANVFRHDLLQTAQTLDIWHLLLFTAVGLFLADVTVRRLSIPVGAMAAATVGFVRQRLLRRAPAESVMLNRLRVRKAEVASQINARQQRMAVPEADAAPAISQNLDARHIDDQTIDQLLETSGPQRPAAASSSPTPDPRPQPPTSHTSRLLEAKRKLWEARRDSAPKDDQR